MLLTLHIGPVVIARLSYFLEYRLYFSIRYESYEIIVLFLHHRRSWDGKGQRAKVLALEEEVINTMQQVLGAVECRKNMDSGSWIQTSLRLYPRTSKSHFSRLEVLSLSGQDKTCLLGLIFPYLNT